MSSTPTPPTPEPSTVAARARSSLPPTHTSKIPFFASAAQPEIVRANQKDLYYLAQLTERFEDVSRSLLGTRWLQAWSKELTQGSRLAYFGLTTLLGSQTLGEEYCDIMQYAVQTRKPPTRRRRAAMLALHIVVPYILASLYSSARRALISRNEAALQLRAQEASIDLLFSTAPPPPPPQTIWTRIMDGSARLAVELPSFETLTEDYLRSVHLAIFYLSGRYYSLSKRASGIRFISTQSRRSAATPAASATSPPSSYEVLGVLMAIQLTVRSLLALHRLRSPPSSIPSPSKSSKGKFTVDGRPLSSLTFDPDDAEQASAYPEEEEGKEARERRCTLCLGGRRDPTATECGHVFCWECVVGWAREKPECPLCRQAIHLSKLLPLYNLM